MMMNLVVICQTKKYTNILDAGCGPGISSKMIQFDMKNDAILYGFDYSEKMVEIAVKNYQNENYNTNNNYDHGLVLNQDNLLNIQRDNENLRKNYQGKIFKFFHADAEKLFIEDEQFELYLSNYVLQITNDPEKMLKEAYRVLKPNGRAGFSIWGKKEESNHFSVLEDILAKKGIKMPANRSNYYLSENMDKLMKMLQDIGFKNVKYEFVHNFNNTFEFEEFRKFVFIGPNSRKLMEELSSELIQEIENEIERYYYEIFLKDHKFITLHSCIIKADK